MARPNLTFVTHTNQAQMRAAPELEPYWQEQARLEREREQKEKEGEK
jgi:hypothetical protein